MTPPPDTVVAAPDDTSVGARSCFSPNQLHVLFALRAVTHSKRHKDPYSILSSANKSHQLQRTRSHPAATPRPPPPTPVLSQSMGSRAAWLHYHCYRVPKDSLISNCSFVANVSDIGLCFTRKASCYFFIFFCWNGEPIEVEVGRVLKVEPQKGTKTRAGEREHPEGGSDVTKRMNNKNATSAFGAPWMRLEPKCRELSATLRPCSWTTAKL